MSVKEEEKGSLAEQQIASWQEKLKTEISGWDNLSPEAQRALADIAGCLEEETAMAQKREPERWAAADDVAHAMRRALSRGWKAALAGVNSGQLLEAFEQGSTSIYKKE